MKLNVMISALLLFGIVDQINGDKAVVEYEFNGRVMYSTVSLSQSACIPNEGQPVFFFEGYKIVTCEVKE